MDFSQKLMELRKSRGWSQEQLGDKLGVTRQFVLCNLRDIDRVLCDTPERITEWTAEAAENGKM